MIELVLGKDPRWKLKIEVEKGAKMGLPLFTEGQIPTLCFFANKGFPPKRG